MEQLGRLDDGDYLVSMTKKELGALNGLIASLRDVDTYCDAPEVTIADAFVAVANWNRTLNAVESAFAAIHVARDIIIGNFEKESPDAT